MVRPTMVHCMVDLLLVAWAERVIFYRKRKNAEHDQIWTNESKKNSGAGLVDSKSIHVPKKLGFIHQLIF